MEFIPYHHVERLENDECNGILNGDKLYISPKLDGTNASFWWDSKKNKIMAGSRNRVLSEGHDNRGFLEYVSQHKGMLKIAKTYPKYIFYGEWLVPHTIKHYKEDVWREFYLFDIYDRVNEQYLYPNSTASINCFWNKIKTLPCTVMNIADLNPEDVKSEIHSLVPKVANYLCKNDEIGEGIVIKNYDFVNKYGRTPWGKVVREQFKTASKHKVPLNKIENGIEQAIVDKYITKEFCHKELAKIKNDVGWDSKLIPRLLGVIWHEFITEEMWDIVKKYKMPTVDFRLLNKMVIAKIKEHLSEVF